MVHRLDFDLGLHRLAAAADGGGSGDYHQLEGLKERCKLSRRGSARFCTILGALDGFSCYTI